MNNLKNAQFRKKKVKVFFLNLPNKLSFYCYFSKLMKIKKKKNHLGAAFLAAPPPPHGFGSASLFSTPARWLRLAENNYPIEFTVVL